MSDDIEVVDFLGQPDFFKQSAVKRAEILKQSLIDGESEVDNEEFELIKGRLQGLFDYANFESTTWW